MEVKILKYDHFGNGLGKLNEKIIFVKKALPDEVIDINIIKEKSKYIEGNISKIIKQSKERRESICPFYHKCNGCNFLHTTYEAREGFNEI